MKKSGEKFCKISLQLKFHLFDPFLGRNLKKSEERKIFEINLSKVLVFTN
jgi:hypothetical protein